MLRVSILSRLIALGVASLAIGLVGCKKANSPSDVPIRATQGNPASNPTTGSATAPTAFLFDDKKDGVQFRYTSNWVSKPDKDYVLQLVPADASSDRKILFDVPDL